VSPTLPKKALGQHFLVDENLLGVIARLARLDASDVVLEIGPGLGVLTRYLAERVAAVHAVEIDRSLESALEPVLGDHAGVRLHWGDALRLDLRELTPAPRKLVANLPYNVATPIVAESLLRMPSIDLWCVMLQREVADRFFASPSTKAYGAVSVLVQLTARRTGFHAVSRHVFRPPPRVDSALVAFERVAPPARLEQVLDLAGAAFSHRRKTLANAVALAGLADRRRAESALADIGRDVASRAEALAPAEFVALEESLRA
jgi:16S rRNA (adenine1518-N6/adenine1519-N6)-dimethyltransferase